MGHLRDAFLQALAAHDMTQSKFAEMADVSRSNITYFVNGGVPRDELFRSIFSLWKSDATASHLFRAHLLDEAERAGVDLARLEAASASTADLLAIEEDLHSLRLLLIADPEVRPFIRNMAKNFKAAAKNTVTFVKDEISEVAEDAGSYGKKPAVKKKAKTKRAST